MLWAILIIPICLYLTLCIVLFLLQSRLVYQPTAEILQSPSAMGMAYEAVTFAAPDGVELKAFWTPAEDAKATVLFCHGNGGNIGHRVETIFLLRQLGLNSLVFDYRGYGASTGRPSEEGTYRDARAAWDWLVDTKGIDPRTIIVHGRSLGGPIAAHLAREVQPAALILESTFSSAPALAQRMYPIFPARLLCRFRYDTVASLGQVRVPVLVIHSPDDTMVPLAEGRAVFDAAGEPKQFLQIRGGHNEGFWESGGDYTGGIADFLRRHVQATAE